MSGTGEPAGLRVLAIDDERPALDEIAYLLQRDPRIAGVLTCDSATEALRTLQNLEVDAVFLDIQMPGLSGLDLAQVLSRFKAPPPIVFVTAHEEHAVSAFDLRAVDYVLKPVREARLAEAIRRVIEANPRVPSGDVRSPSSGPVSPGSSTAPTSPTWKPRETTRVCTPPRVPTSSVRPCPRWPRSGLTRGSYASTAPPSSRCRTSRRYAATPGGSVSWSAAPSCRSAAVTPASCARCSPAGRRRERAVR